MCSSNAECDDEDPCTSGLCDLSRGECRTSSVDACREHTPLLEEDFESRIGQPMNDLVLFASDDWRADRGTGCPVGLDVTFAEPFDRYKAESFASGEGGWDLAATGGAAITLKPDPDSPDDLAMDVRATITSGSYAQAGHQVTAQASGWIEFRFRPAGPTKAKWIGLNEGDLSRVLLHFDSDGMIRYRSDGPKVALASYEGGRWYGVRISWNAATDRVDIAIDGVNYANLKINQPIEEFIDRVRFRTATGTGLSFLVDDVVASGGEGVHSDGSSTLRVGTPDGDCGESTSAVRTLPPVESGAFEVDLMASAGDQAHTVQLSAGEDAARGAMALSLDPDGRVRWQVGEVKSTLAVDTGWTPGQWMHVELRWDAAGEAADLWIDRELVAVGLHPIRPITAGIDHLRATASAGAALWIDNLRVLEPSAGEAD